MEAKFGTAQDDLGSALPLCGRPSTDEVNGAGWVDEGVIEGEAEVMGALVSGISATS